MGWIFKRQTPKQTQAGVATGSGLDLYTAAAQQSMDTQVCPPATIKTYKQMRVNPTLVLARAAFSAPILVSNWSTQADDDASDDEIKYLDEMIKNLRMRYLTNALQYLEYGFKAFEIVWESEDGRFKVNDLKPLNVDATRPKLDDHGELIGLDNYGTELVKPYYAWVACDAEDDNPRGRSRYENVRESAWWGWHLTFLRQQQYMLRVAAPIPMIEYPPGVSKEASGSERSNFEIAQMLTRQLGKGLPIVMPNTLAAAARDLLERGVPYDKVKAWAITFVEAASQHGAEFIDTMRYYDSLMMRGWLVPERTATEGQMGTKAEAGVHSALAIQIAQLILKDLVDQFNKQIVEIALQVNFGKARVRVESMPLSDPVLQIIESIMTSVLSGNPTLLETWLDVDAMLDKLGLPKAEQIVPQGIGPAISRVLEAGQEKLEPEAGETDTGETDTGETDETVTGTEEQAVA